MMRSSDPLRAPVVIVGAGPTGVTAAILLAQYGVESLVLDRWDDVYPQPRAVHLDDEVYRILDRLGVADAFAAISRPARGLQLLDKDLHVLAEFQRDSTPSAQGFPQANMFDQPELESVLREQMKRHAAVTFRGSVEVTGLIHVGLGLERVLFTDRDTGEEHVVDANFVLGCDGANSLVRSNIGARMDDLKFEQRWLVVDVDTDVDLHQWEGVHQVCDSTRAATYMRIGETRYRWEFRLHDHESAADYNAIDRLLPLITPWVRDAPPDRLELVRVTEYTFRAQLADRWREGNVFILGDAAHLTPPFIGQGMGAGIRDAMNLTWKIAGVLASTLSPSVFDTYQQERKPHVHALIRLTLVIGWAMTGGGDAGDFVRRTVVPRLGLIPGMRKRIVDSRTPALHRSPFVAKTVVPGQLAGTLAPNSIVKQQVRLNTLMANRFAVVTTRVLSPRDRELVDRRGAIVVQAQRGSELAAWLAHGHAKAAIVRPDMTVMRAGRRLSALCGHVPVFTPPRPRRPHPSPVPTPGEAPMPDRRDVPSYRPDIYSTEAILDPYPHYARLRQLGPVVWLAKQKVYALPRYAECKAVLKDDATFISGRGVALNAVTNRMSRGTTLNSDGAEHDLRRKLVAHRLTPRALRNIGEAITTQAAEVVSAAVAKRTVDGVRDLATALPLAIVPDFVGWPQEGRDQLLEWAGATFDILGPMNMQNVRAIPASVQMLRFSKRVVRERSIREGSLGHDVLVAADEGKLAHSECSALMIDYLAPSLDTTISAIASALHLFATHPNQWQAIKDDPSLIPNAVNEVVRFRSPLRAFSRKASRDAELAGVTIPSGARVLVLYASANRDELEWTDPDSFDIHRNAIGQLGFGHGTHGCAGQGLARLETQAILNALVERVDSIRCAGEPTWAVNNIIHRFEQLPLELIPSEKGNS